MQYLASADLFAMEGTGPYAIRLCVGPSAFLFSLASANDCSNAHRYTEDLCRHCSLRTINVRIISSLLDRCHHHLEAANHQCIQRMFLSKTDDIRNAWKLVSTAPNLLTTPFLTTTTTKNNENTQRKHKLARELNFFQFSIVFYF